MLRCKSRWTRWAVGSIAALTLLAGVAAGWAAGVNLTGAGASFPYPLYSKWMSVYQQAAGVNISYNSIGSGGGIQQLKNKTVDFGASDAPLTDAELKDMPGAVVQIPMVAGAVAIVYNVPDVAKLRLTADVVTDIYRGKIARWNDKRIAAINPGMKLPNLAIAVAHRSDGSGTSFIFTSYLSAVSPAWKKQVGAGKSVNWPVGIGAKGNEGVAGIVKQTVGGIGYVELAYARQNSLRVASLRNSAGQYVAPTTASTTAAAAGFIGAMKKDVRVSIVNAPGKTAYPIAGFTYIMVYKEQKDAATGKALVDFLRWAVNDGQKYATPLLYAALPAEVVKINQAKIKSISVPR
jgi:phosphate transport system substrate-binding protein